MKILILGGTGAMGLHLVQLLSNDSMDVYVTSRTARSSKKNVKYIHGNAHDITFLKNLLKERWDAIVDFMVYDTLSFKARVNILLEATHQYIFLSSARVYADSESPITETSPRLLDISLDSEYLKTDEYALTKARQEDVLCNSGYNNWTIIRPYITYSENRFQLGVLEKETWLYRALHNRTIVFSKDIEKNKTTLTYGYDVARGIISIIGEKSAYRQAFHITVDESYTWGDIFELYLNFLEKELGKRPKVLLIEKNPRVTLSNSKWQVLYDRYYNRCFDNTNIKKYIDTSTFKDTEEGLKECLKYYIIHPNYIINSWNEHAMYDRITGEWTCLKEIPTWKQRIKYLLRRTILPKK